MSLATYSDLQTALSNWTHRDDLTAVWPDCIRLAEARLNRKLRVRPMEADFSATLSSGEAALPSDFLAFKELRFDGDQNYSLQPRSLDWVKGQDSTATGDPLYFAVSGTNVVCWPRSGSVEGTYFQSIPALASNSTNWLLTAHPDLYLFASLVETALYTQDDGRIPLWASKASELLDQVQRMYDNDEHTGGSLVVRAG